MNKLSKRLRKSYVAYGFLAPAFVVIIIFTVVPTVVAIFYSLTDWGLAKTFTFVGLSNYLSFLKDDIFILAFRNTLIYTIGVVSGITVFSLALALLVNSGLYLRTLFRTIYFLPSISSMAIVAVIWSIIYNPTFGLLNYLLGKLGIPPQMWLLNHLTAWPSIIVMEIWRSAGYFMIVFLAGLQGIPQSLYDAAAVDGANRWNSFLHVTLPLLRPTILFVVVVSTINSFQVFDSIYIMTGGGPAHQTEVLASLIYQTGFLYFRFGKASAMAVVFAIIIFTISYIQRRLITREVEY